MFLIRKTCINKQQDISMQEGEHHMSFRQARKSWRKKKKCFRCSHSALTLCCPYEDTMPNAEEDRAAITVWNKNTTTLMPLSSRVVVSEGS